MSKLNLACIIDDDVIFTYSMRRMIDATALVENTLFFENGQAALDYFKDNRYREELIPDLILLDLNMPVLDGWQFLNEYTKIIPEINKKVKLYIVSSSIDDDDHQRASKIEFVTDFIVKPVYEHQLKKMVNEV